MTRLPALVPVLLLALLLTPLTAQSHPAGLSPDLPSPGRPTIIPLHSHPDDPVFGPYGIRAGGIGYKAKFATDGVEVTPYLEPTANVSRDARSLRWTTHSVTVGGATLALRSPHEHIVSKTRYEVDRGAVVEAWDVGANGLEQTFTVATRPSTGGDLVVRGTLEGHGLLATRSRVEDHAALTWTDESGTAALRYGAASLVDAAGRVTPLATTYDHGEVRLTVPSDLLGSSMFPITIDPLIEPLDFTVVVREAASVAAATNSMSRCYAIVQNTNPDGGDLMVFTDSSLPFAAFADLSGSSVAQDPDVAYIQGTSQFVIAYTRIGFDPVSTFPDQARIRVGLVNPPSFPIGSQLVILPSFATGPFVAQDWRPAISGSGSIIDTVSIVAESQDLPAWSPTFQSACARAIWFRTSSASITAGPFDIAGPGVAEPDVLPQRDEDENLFVYVYSKDVGGGGEQIVARAQEFDLSMSAEHTLASTGPGVPSLGAPKIAGDRGQYCVAWTEEGSSLGVPTRSTRVARMFWPSGGMPQNLRFNDYPNLIAQAIDFDDRTRSHWAMGYLDFASSERGVMRLGWNGGETDRLTFPLTPGFERTGGVQLGFDFEPSPADGTFLVSWSETPLGMNAPVARTARYVYPTALAFFVADGCGVETTSTNRPYRGHQFFGVNLSGPDNAPAILLVSLLPQTPPISLGFLGLPQCDLGVDLNFLVLTPAVTTSASGFGRVEIPLPEPIEFDFWMQWLYVDPGVGLLLADTVRVEVR